MRDVVLRIRCCSALDGSAATGLIDCSAKAAASAAGHLAMPRVALFFMGYCVRRGSLWMSKGPVADDGGAHHSAHLREVVDDRVVLRRAVVPEGDGVRAPLEAHLVLGRRGLQVEV